MKECPKSFGSEEVKAILEGRKTQFQEAIKIPKYGRIKPATQYDPPCDSHSGGVAICFDLSGLADWKTLACPYGQVGGRLWVREPWALRNDGHQTMTKREYESIVTALELPSINIKWKSATFMPRSVSRITLEITGIRVEELQEITEADAEAESPPCWDTSEGLAPSHSVDNHFRYHFRELWNSSNAKRGYSWESNPWVWVVEFQKLV